MRRWAFVIALIGLFVLSLFFGFYEKEVDSLDDLEVNSRVIVWGLVESERVVYFGSRLLILDSGIKVICECSGDFEGRVVRVEGIVEEYEGKKQVRVLEMRSVN